MNENEMSQQEHSRPDAKVIAAMQQHIAKAVYEEPPQSDMFLISTNMRDIIEYALAERRERMRLRDELARAYTDLADMHEGEGYHNDAKRYRARAAALASAERDGAGTDADGEGTR